MRKSGTLLSLILEQQAQIAWVNAQLYVEINSSYSIDNIATIVVIYFSQAINFLQLKPDNGLCGREALWRQCALTECWPGRLVKSLATCCGSVTCSGLICYCFWFLRGQIESVSLSEWVCAGQLTYAFVSGGVQMVSNLVTNIRSKDIDLTLIRDFANKGLIKLM